MTSRGARNSGSEPGRSQYVDAALVVASYALWFVTAAAGLLDVLLARRLLLESVIALGVNPWAHGAIDKFGLVALGIFWLAMILLVQNRYEKRAANGLRPLLSLFVWLTASQLAFAGLAVLVTALLV